jgi:predicted TIM-barrel fold metal-dependent hydrolase
VFHSQLTELAGLALAFPDTRIIVNHLGGPLAIGPYANDPQQSQNEWQRGMLELRDRPNVTVKIGGLVMPPLTGRGSAVFTSDEFVDQWSERIRWCIAAFGPDRCMFESNFPFDKRWIAFVPLLNAYKRIVSDHTPAEKQALFAGTVARVYELESQPA